MNQNKRTRAQNVLASEPRDLFTDLHLHDADSELLDRSRRSRKRPTWLTTETAAQVGGGKDRVDMNEAPPSAPKRQVCFYYDSDLNSVICVQYFS